MKKVFALAVIVFLTACAGVEEKKEEPVKTDSLVPTVDTASVALVVAADSVVAK